LPSWTGCAACSRSLRRDDRFDRTLTPRLFDSQVADAADEIFYANLATMVPGAGAYGAVADGALAVKAGRIAWAGPRSAMPAGLLGPGTTLHDAGDGWITPALIDCHTHLVFAGERSAEFEARLRGDSYEAAARRGGGILSTVRATQAASEAALIEQATPRLARLMADGVRTIEIKSGYGLTLDSELAMLRVGRALGRAQGVRVRTTLLAAHAVPPEFAGRADDYVDHIVADILPAAAEAGLCDAVDAFAETIAFSNAQIARVFTAARDLGLGLKLHADQLSDGDGAAFAAGFGALSADHLEYCSEDGARAMGRAGTVAVLLPGAYATVGARQPPPVEAFRTHGVGMAVATDCNPGSSPLCSLLMAVNLTCALFRLTPEEALAGVTREAARALGLADEVGVLRPGLSAEFAVWRVGHPRELAYWMGGVAPTLVRTGAAA
jgi:imidazolonepropionase